MTERKISRLDDMPQYECGKDDNELLQEALGQFIHGGTYAMTSVQKEQARELLERIQNAHVVIIVEDKS